MTTFEIITGRTHLQLDPWGFFPCTVKKFAVLRPLLIEGCTADQLRELIEHLTERAAVAKIDESPKAQRFAAKLLRNARDLEIIAADMAGDLPAPAEVLTPTEPAAPAPVPEHPKKSKQPEWIGRKMVITIGERYARPAEPAAPAPASECPKKSNQPEWIGRKMIITIGERYARPAEA